MRSWTPLYTLNSSTKVLRTGATLKCFSRARSFTVPPAEVIQDIINRDILGRKLLFEFVDERLMKRSVDFFSHRKRNNLKFFKDSGAMTITKVSGHLITLTQERNLIARFLVAAGSRPNLVPSEAIGEYEFHVCPPSNFYTDGTMYMIPNKHQLVSETMKLPIDLTDNLHSTDSILSKSAEESVLIIDAMCVVQSFKVAKDIQSASKLADLFVTKIRSMAANYKEVRVLFDRYLDVSLKHMTRTQRVSKMPLVHYHVTDSTLVRNMKTFLAHVRTKDEVTCYLAEKLLAAFKQEKKAVVVSFRNVVQSNVQLDEVVSLPELQKGRHELEEADQQIILHAIDIGRRVPQPKLSVYSLDTDVLVLLTGFYTQIPSQTTVIRKADEKISISEIYYWLGCHRAEALIGWYAFKGCDSTGSFSTKSLKSNFSAFWQVMQTF
jgi:hypothetical protein